MNKRNIMLIIVIIITSLILTLCIYTVYFLRGIKKGNINSTWTKEDELEYSSLLLAKGLNRAAAEEMKRYLDNPPLSSNKTKLAKISYELGNIYMGLYEYEKALKYFYRSEMLSKKPPFKDDRDKKIVEALERLGMSSQAEYELETRTSIGKNNSSQNKNIIARIGKRKITKREIDEAINTLPSWMKSKMQDENERANFIKQYIANEVLYEKAKNLSLDKKPEIRKRIEDFKKQIIIQAFIKEQLNKKLHIDPSDVKLYYEANKDRYTQKERIKVRYITIPKESKDTQYLERLKNGEGESTWIHKGDTYINNIGEAKETIEKLFEKNKGEILGPISIKDKKYVFIIDDKKPRRIKSFDEVKDEVNYEYKMDKKKEIINSLIKNALESKDVEIYYKDSKNE